MSQTVQVQFTAPQVAMYAHAVPGNVVCLPWGRGLGKSWWQRVMWWLAISKWDGVVRDTIGGGKQRGVRIIALMDTLKHFKDVHLDLMIDEIEGQWSFLGGKVDRGTGAVRFPGGSWIKPFPAAEHHAKAGRGMRADVLSMDECDDVEMGVYDSVCVPWFSEPWSLNLRILGGTPRRGRYGLLYRTHRRGLSDEWPNHHTLRATYRDCPELVSSRVVDEARRGDPRVFQREWECNFDSSEGLVYDLFEEGFHVREHDPDAYAVEALVGCDWGYADPGVFILMLVYGHGQDATIHIVDEVYEPGKVLDWWVARAEKTVAKYPRSKWFCDPSQPANIESLRTRAGCNIQRLGRFTIDEGLACVANLLAKRTPDTGEPWARMYVHPRCANTINEFRSYKRKSDPQNRDRYLDSVQDKNNHAMDALRYAAFAHFGKVPRTRVEWTAHEVI